MKTYYVYILASKPYGTLYIGVTSDLIKRVYEHKTKAADASFTAKYNVNQLVYFEETNEIYSAISREKLLKKWNMDPLVKLQLDSPTVRQVSLARG